MHIEAINQKIQEESDGNNDAPDSCSGCGNLAIGRKSSEAITPVCLLAKQGTDIAPETYIVIESRADQIATVTAPDALIDLTPPCEDEDIVVIGLLK
jgi:hypothetical protein